MSRSTPRLLAAGVLLAAVALVAVWATRGRRDAESVERRDGAIAAAEHALAELAPPETIEPPPAPAPEPRREPVDAKEVAARARAARPGVAGTFVVDDALGNLHRREDGTVRLEIGNRNVIAMVRAGAWSAPAWPGESVEFVRAWLGDRPVFVDEDSKELRVSAEGTLDLLGHWDPAVELLVLDAKTGAHLQGVELYEVPAGTDRGASPDTDGLPARVGLSSPIALTPLEPLGRLTERHYWIYAPGHAWDEIQVDFAEDPRVRKHLDPGGDLLVRVSGHDPEQSYVVGLRHDRARRPISTRWSVPADGSVDLRGIDPGIWHVSLELRLSGVIEYLDAARIELPPGGSIPVALEANPPEGGAGVPLAGVVVPAPRADPSAYAIEVRSAGGIPGVTPPLYTLSSGDLEPVAGGAGELAWDTGLLTPGPYWIRVLPSLEELALDLVSPGRTDLILEPRETARVVLRVVDARTGEDFGPEALNWESLDDPDAPAGARESGLRRPTGAVDRSPQTGLYEFTAPVGTLLVWKSVPIITTTSVLGDEFVGWDATVRIEPGENVLTLELDRGNEHLNRLRMRNLVRHEPGD